MRSQALFLGSPTCCQEPKEIAFIFILTCCWCQATSMSQDHGIISLVDHYVRSPWAIWTIGEGRKADPQHAMQTCGFRVGFALILPNSWRYGTWSMSCKSFLSCRWQKASSYVLLSNKKIGRMMWESQLLIRARRNCEIIFALRWKTRFMQHILSMSIYILSCSCRAGRGCKTNTQDNCLV